MAGKAESEEAMTMLEKMAMAIAGRHPASQHWDYLTQEMRDERFKDIRAALVALRDADLTPEIIGIGQSNGGGTYEVERTFRAMIDAILNEKE